MSDVLPSELFWGILSRLPTEPLLRFRCVCSQWRHIIDDRAFVRSHIRCQSGGNRILITSPAAHTTTTTTTTTKFYTSSLESFSNFESETTIWAEPISLDVPNIRTRSPLPWCDGLILIYDEQKFWSLWNPCTRKCFELPPPPYDDDDDDDDDDVKRRRSGFLCGGLGYDLATDDYKVVRITQFFDRNIGIYIFETSIYSLKLNYWKKIEGFPNCYIYFRNKHGVFVNGALHWITYELRRGQVQEMGWIIALDLGTENYRLLPLPSVLSARDDWVLIYNPDLSVVDGCLFLSFHSSKYGLVGWMMKDYGGTNSSWTKLFSFDEEHLRNDTLRFIAYSKNQDKAQVLVQHSDDEILWLDVDKKSTKRVIVGGAPTYFTSQVFPTSLVRLHDQKKIN